MKSNLLRKPALILSVFSLALSMTVAAQQADSLDVTHYFIHLDEIDMNTQSIRAHTLLRATTPYEGLSAAKLSLMQLTVDSVKVDGNLTADYSHEGYDLVIQLPQTLNPGDTAGIEVFYQGSPYHEDWGGFHFSGNYAFNLGVGLNEIPHNLGKTWFPCVDNFTDRAIYDIHATVPDHMTAVCGGLLVEETSNGNGTRTFYWKNIHSLPTYLVSIAVGEYVAVRDTFYGVNEDIPIAYYVRPQDTSKVAGTFVNLKDVLNMFEDRMGPYPWERVGYVSTAIGAMEHAANIAVPHFTISGNTGYEALMVHELTHMWLGDKVTCDKAEEMWLNEGWAKFFEIYYTEDYYGRDVFKETMRDLHGSVLQSCHTPGGDGDYFPQNDIPQTHTYGMTAYDKGATVTQALRFYLGDSLFFDALKSYTESFAYHDASSYDMRDHFTTATGIDMSAFFDNWVFNAGMPAYSLDSFTVTPSGSEYVVEVATRQKRKGPAFTGDRNVVELTFMGEEWQQITDTVVFDGETGISSKLLPFEPVEVFIDAEERMCDATTDNCMTLSETGDHTFPETFFKIGVESITDSAFVQAIHFWVPPDSLKEPVNGLRLSDYRYWRVAGIFPEGFQASGSFFYTRNGYLDNTLITTETDSVVILYRRDATEDWQEIPFERIGLWNIGNLIVQDLQPGEYTLAVWDLSVHIEEKEHGTGMIEIYPNPTDGNFSILLDVDRSCILRMCDMQGRVIRDELVQPTRQLVRWNAKELPAGTYIVSIADPEGRKLADRKLVLQ